jgi:6-phosphogluconolactonase
MKFSKLSQLFLVSIIGLMVATLLTSCEIVTIDYVFVASSSGSERQRTDRSKPTMWTPNPAPSALGSRPCRPAEQSRGHGRDSDYANLYVANQGNNSVVHFSVAGNGVLSNKDTVTTATPPVALTVKPGK